MKTKRVFFLLTAIVIRKGICGSAYDKICGQSLSSKIPVDMNSIFMKLYVT